jgi:hypothetical protein
MDWVDNCECQNKYGYTTDHTSIKWLQLTQGYLKCNVDATFSDTAGATCWGWCLCEYQGRVILAGSNVIQARHNTIEGEVMTMKEAISELIQKTTLIW